MGDISAKVDNVSNLIDQTNPPKSCVKQLRSMQHITVAVLHITAMRHVIVMLEAMQVPHMTGISNVVLLHEINDRTRVLKRIMYEMINDTDMNA